jgi:glycosyltransferase involved in cell wall biosynthesis
MNILLISYHFLPGFEGSTSLITIIADLLAKNGHKVWVITHKFQGIEYKTHPNIKIVFVSSELPFGENKTSLIKTIRFTLTAIQAGLKIIKKEKIDIIHSNAIAGPAGAWLSYLSSKKHIMLLHDVYSADPNFWKEWKKQEGNSSFNALLGKLLEKIYVHSRYAAIHTVSEASRDDLIKVGVKKPIYVIHNAIPIKEAEITITNPYQFVYVGRLVFYKNLQVVIKALRLLKERFPKINLIIIGKGPYRNYLEKLVEKYSLQNNVIFKGYLSEEEKNKLLAESQALVFLSLFEAFGLVILEAFMQKKPVLVSNVRPLSDIVEHKKTGLVISPNDENAWTTAMEAIIKDPLTAARMGSEGRKEIDEKYSLERLEEKLGKMYKEILDNFTVNS